mgnify:CR=1 FL=1
MTQIGSKEIKRIKRSIESGEYDLEKCMNLRNAKLRVELARHGLHVDMLAERDEPRVIVALIEKDTLKTIMTPGKPTKMGMSGMPSRDVAIIPKFSSRIKTKMCGMQPSTSIQNI